MFDILKKQMDVLRNILIKDDYEPQREQPIRNAITIRINSGNFGEPQIQITPKPIAVAREEPYRTRRLIERKLPEKVVEPEVNVKRLAKEMIFTIPLPDVKMESDIILTLLEDSVEIKAFAKDKGYFKILSIPKNYKLIEKSLNNDSLSLKFAI
jgi:HSP20 family molecular chaperone IbpA